jgi:hypothetical protein
MLFFAMISNHEVVLIDLEALTDLIVAINAISATREEPKNSERLNMKHRRGESVQVAVRLISAFGCFSAVNKLSSTTSTPSSNRFNLPKLAVSKLSTSSVTARASTTGASTTGAYTEEECNIRTESFESPRFSAVHIANWCRSAANGGAGQYEATITVDPGDDDTLVDDRESRLVSALFEVLERCSDDGRAGTCEDSKEKSCCRVRTCDVLVVTSTKAISSVARLVMTGAKVKPCFFFSMQYLMYLMNNFPPPPSPFLYFVL